MERFHGRLRDGDRVIFERVTGQMESRDDGRWATATGRFEVHQGGVLGNALPTDRAYGLELDDGRTGTIHVTRVHASNSAGIARVEFRLADALVVGTESPVAAPG